MSKCRPYLRARLTREGWYYLAVLTFIVAGAALTHVNLLVMLGGMMLAPLLINWRLGVANVRGVHVRRRPLRPVHAGQPLLVEFEVSNPRRWLAAWVVVVEESWRLIAEDPRERRVARSLREWIAQKWRKSLRAPEQETRASALAMTVGPGETARVSYELLIPRRGRYQSAEFRWRSTFPLGLIEVSCTDYRQSEVLILPRLARLTAEWSQLVTTAISGGGDWQVRQRASEGDYFAVRPWQTGDSLRWMHWRTTARTGRPMVRQFEHEASSVVAIVLDPFLPAEPATADQARFEAAISFTATALSDLAERDVGELVLVVAGSESKLWRGPRSAVFLDHVMVELGKLSGHSSDFREQAWQKVQDEVPEAAAVLVVTARHLGEAAASTSDSVAAHTIVVGSEEFNALYTLE